MLWSVLRGLKISTDPLGKSAPSFVVRVLITVFTLANVGSNSVYVSDWRYLVVNTCNPFHTTENQRAESGGFDWTLLTIWSSAKFLLLASISLRKFTTHIVLCIDCSQWLQLYRDISLRAHRSTFDGSFVYASASVSQSELDITANRLIW